MKVVVTTTYKNIDDDWIDWFVKRLKKQDVPIDFDAFERGQKVSFTSKDPTSNATAITKLKISEY